MPGPTAANSAQQLHYGASPCARSLLGGSPTGEEDTQVCGLSEELVKQIVQIQLGELKALFQEKHCSCRGRYVGSGPWLRRKLGLSTSKAQATLDAKFDTLVVGDEEHPRYDQRTAERLRKAFLKKHGWAPNSDIETSAAWVEERLGLVDGRWDEMGFERFNDLRIGEGRRTVEHSIVSRTAQGVTVHRPNEDRFLLDGRPVLSFDQGDFPRNGSPRFVR